MSELKELARHEYSKLTITSGKVIDGKPDAIYLRIEQEDQDGKVKQTTLYFQEHEALSIIAILTGTLWHGSVDRMEKRRTVLGTISTGADRTGYVLIED